MLQHPVVLHLGDGALGYSAAGFWNRLRRTRPLSGRGGRGRHHVEELEPALRRGLDRITRENRPHLIDVTVACEGVGADSTWHQDWQL